MSAIINDIKNRMQAKTVVQSRIQPVVTVSHSKADSILSLRYCDHNNVDWTDANKKPQQLLMSSKKLWFTKPHSSTSFVPAIIINLSKVDWKKCILSNEKTHSKIAPGKITD